jgi:hypothetical protein
MDDSDQRLKEAQDDFERHFGVHEKTKVYYDEFGLEDVIVVETPDQRAYYSYRIELLKILNLKGEIQ